ncbi:MAG TPA: hypothetical protein VIN71_09780, partial [Pseudomonadales bacterium]
LGAVSSNGFALFSSGNIIGHDVVASSGLNRFFTQYGSVVLDNSANQLGVIGGVAKQDITLVSSDALVVSPFAIDGKLTLKAGHVDFAAKTAIDGDWIGLSAPLTNHVGSLHVEAANIGTGALVKAEPLQDSLRRFSVDGEVTLVGNVIDFDHAEFAGPVNITATGPVKILNSGFDLQLGNVQASDLFLSSSGSIRGSAVIEAAGTSYLAATHDVVLDNAQNDFGQVYVFNTSGNNNVVLRDRNDILLNAGSALASLDVEVGGEFALAPSTPVPLWVAETGSTGVFLDVSGDARVLAGSLGDFQLGMRVDGDLWLGGHNDLVYNVQESKVTVGGVLDLYAGNNLVVVNPLSEITYPDNSTITIASAGAIVLNSISAGGNADVAGLSILLNDVHVEGDLSLSTHFKSNIGAEGRQITITGPAYVGGDTFIEATGDVTMANAGNRFVGQVNVFDVTALQDKRSPAGNIVSGNDPYVGLWIPAGDFYYRLPEIDVALAASGTLTLGNITLDGGLEASADALVVTGTLSTQQQTSLAAITGAITGSGALSSAVAMDLQAGGLIRLDNSSNDFANGISLSAASVDVTAANIDLTALDTTGDASLQAGNLTIGNSGDALTIGGDLALAVTAGDLFVGRALQVAGDASFTAPGLITIGNNNAVGGKVNATAGALNYAEQGDVLIGTLLVNGNAAVRSDNGSIVTAGSVITIGNDLDFRSIKADLVMNNPDMSIGGVLTADAINIRIVTDSVLNLGEMRADDLVGTRVSSLEIQAAAINASGHLYGDSVSLVATNGDLDAFTSAINTMQLSASGDLAASVGNAATLSLDGNSVNVSYNSDLTTLDDLQVRNNLTLLVTGSSGGNFQYGGVVDINGKLDIATFSGGSPAGVIRLDNPANRVGGTVKLSAASIDYAEAGDVQLAFVDSNQRLAVTSVSGGIFWHGSDSSDYSQRLEFAQADFVAQNGDVRLENLRQTWGGSGVGTGLSVSADNITLVMQGSVRFGSLTASGDVLLDAVSAASGFGGGSLEVDGPVQVAGHTRLLASEQGSIDMGNSSNLFVGGLSIQGGTVDIVSSDSLYITGLTTRTVGFVGQGGPGEPVPAEVRLEVVQGDIVIDGPIDAGALTFVMGADQGDIVATHQDNRIVASALPDDPFDPAPEESSSVLYDISVEGTAGNVTIVDSTDLSLHRVVANGDVTLQSAGSITMVDMPESFDGAGDAMPAVLSAGQQMRLDAAMDFIGSSGTVSAGAGGLWLEAGNDISVAGAISSAADIVLAAGGNFYNDSAMVNPLAAAGRWLVYSTRPDNNTGDMAMARDFHDYGIAYNPADPLPDWLPSGNGLLYSVLPVIEGISLAPIDQSIVYGNDIDRSISSATIGSLGGTATGRLLVDGVEVDAGVFGIDVPTVSIAVDPASLQLD